MNLGRSKNFTLVNLDLSHFLRRWILTQLFWKRGELMVNLDPTNFFKRWTEAKTWGGEVQGGLWRLHKLCYFTRSASIHIAILSNHYIATHLKSCISVQLFRGGFKTQPPVDRRFRPVPPGFYCSELWQPPRTGRNRRSTGGWVLKPPLTNNVLTELRFQIPLTQIQLC